MIRINLLAEKKAPKAKPASVSLGVEGPGGIQNLLLGGIVVVGILVYAGWWWAASHQIRTLEARKVEAQRELDRLADIRKKAEEFKKQKALLEKKIALISDLKKKQSVPVHILDQISKNLPDFLWLDSMTAEANRISITGKATTYTAVSNFYDNLNRSGYFSDVVLGKTAEVAEGVSFSLTCRFEPPASPASPEPAKGREG
jgi:type IV pilus assembly protein PilN